MPQFHEATRIMTFLMSRLLKPSQKFGMEISLLVHPTLVEILSGLYHNNGGVISVVVGVVRHHVQVRLYSVGIRIYY